jgi:S-DNA-T family DNA segregation ATPase FtsK/SpoIIIE
MIQSFEQAEELADEAKEPENELYKQAKEIILATGKASATYLQTTMKIGYPTAARLIDELEARGVIGPKEGAKGRQVLIGRPFADLEE